MHPGTRNHSAADTAACGPITVSRPNVHRIGWLSRWRTWWTTRHSDAVRCLFCSRQGPLPRWAARQRVTQNTRLQMGPCPRNPGWTHVWTPPSDPATGTSR